MTNPYEKAIDDALVVHHIGVASPHHTYEQAKKQLNQLLAMNADIAIYFHEQEKETSAQATLKQLGYTDCGGELWKPPLGTIQQPAPERGDK